MIYTRSRNILPLLQEAQLKNRFLRYINTDVDVKPVKDIVIPQRIKRGPTDILKALAGTVGTDPTSAHYAFHDDPYLTPVTTHEKRVFSLSKQSGIRAVHWIRDLHPDYFDHTPEDPIIKNYLARPVYSEDSEVSEDVLLDVINKGHVLDAITVYNICKDRSIAITPMALQALLELVCYYNSVDCNPSLDTALEHWYVPHSTESPAQFNGECTWKQGQFADDLFASMEDPGPAAYSAIIRGKAKHFYAVGALEHFNNAVKKGMQFDADTYNAAISMTAFMQYSEKQECWEKVKLLLDRMVENNVRPNSGTLDCVLMALHIGCERNTHSRPLSFQILAEFKSIHIEPSLTAYYFILMIHKVRMRKFFYQEIVQDLEGKQLKLTNVLDFFFLLQAMYFATDHQDITAAKFLDDLVHMPGNYRLLGNVVIETRFFNIYLELSCKQEPFLKTWELYKRIIPRSVSLSGRIVTALVNCMNIHSEVSYIPDLWDDCCTARIGHLPVVYEVIVSGLRDFEKDEQNMDTTRRVQRCLRSIWSSVEKQTERKKKHAQPKMDNNKPMVWASTVLDNILILSTKLDMVDLPKKIMEYILKHPTSVNGSLSTHCLQSVLRGAINNANKDIAINIVLYMAGHNISGVEDIVDQIEKEFVLDPLEKAKLDHSIKTNTSSIW